MGQIFITYYIIINLIFKNMKKFTILASLALAFVSLTANATDKFFYKIATDKDPGWTIQDAGNFEGTPGKEYYQAYNKKNGGRMLNFAFPESTWEKIDLGKLPNKTYKWSMDLNMSTMATRSDLELTVLPVGTSLTDSRNSTHNKHWNNANEGEDFFFRFRVVTAPTEANGDFTIQINETPASATDWTVSTNPDSLCVLSSNVKYTFAVEVNTETNVATYSILNGETVVKTGTHEYVCDDRIGVQTLSMNGTSVHQLSNMGLSYFVDGVIAENPSVDLVGDIYDFLEQKNLTHLKELEIAAKQQPQKVAAEPVSQNKINYERKKQIDAKLRKVDKEIQRLEEAIGKLEAELAEQDAIMAHPDEHPNIKIDNDWYWAYGQKKEQLQNLMDDWGEKQMEREEVLAEYEK